jgi:hypothetical protein
MGAAGWGATMSRSVFQLAVQFERDATGPQVDEAYECVTNALKEQGIRFSAQLRVVRDQPETSVRSAMSNLWTGGDLGG